MNITDSEIISKLKEHISYDLWSCNDFDLILSRATTFTMTDYTGDTITGFEFPCSMVNIRLSVDGEFVDADPC